MLAVAAALPIVAGCGSSDGAAENGAAPAVTILMSDAIAVDGATGVYTHADGGTKTQIRFPIAADRVDPNLYHDVQRIGEGGGVVAVLDTYGSEGGGERCANGRESWLRLFSVTKRDLIDSIPVSSCLDQVAAGEPSVTWSDDSFTITGKEPHHFKIVSGAVIRE
ncbi:hypothetical protein SPMU_08450 [Sphingomonas mucosissima]|uniref:Uncharacterized protein n=2 Tax=Sphingomonas mucosissima TaxID=370959 RepID=A0A245ZRZ7_9SPHN|nr:hypothetical protein SPMU_08450 [Sphingomonas mucosissima]